MADPLSTVSVSVVDSLFVVTPIVCGVWVWSLFC